MRTDLRENVYGVAEPVDPLARQRGGRRERDGGREARRAWHRLDIDGAEHDLRGARDGRRIASAGRLGAGYNAHGALCHVDGAQVGALAHAAVKREHLREVLQQRPLALQVVRIAHEHYILRARVLEV